MGGGCRLKGISRLGSQTAEAIGRAASESLSSSRRRELATRYVGSWLYVYRELASGYLVRGAVLVDGRAAAAGHRAEMTAGGTGEWGWRDFRNVVKGRATGTWPLPERFSLH